MADEDIKMLFEGDDRGLLRSFLAINGAVKQVDENLNQIGKKAKAGNTEFSAMNGLLKTATTSAVGFVGSFASFGSVLKIAKDYNEQLKEMIGLQKEYKTAAASTEQLAIKIANLPGRKDLSAEGLKKVGDLITSISMQTGISRDVAKSLLFYSESAMGSGPAGMTAAMNIARFASSAQLAPEEVKQLPKLFNLTGATGSEQQNVVLSKLYQAAGNSIAETGEFLNPFVSAVTNYLNRGYSYEESLARMTSAVEATGSVAEAGEMTERLAAITTGRNKKAMEFLEKEAKKQRMDFSSMADPQRTAFVQTLWDQYSASGKRDMFKSEMDSRGYEAMLALFGPAAQKKYNEILPLVSNPDLSALGTMHGQYMGSITAKSNVREAITASMQTDIGQGTSGATAFWGLVDELHNQMRASPLQMGERISLALRPEISEKNSMAKSLAERLIYPRLWSTERGTPEYQELYNLKEELYNTPVWRDKPELLNRLGEMTGGFKQFSESPVVLDDIYNRTINTYVEKLEKLNNTMDALKKSIDENNRKTEANTRATGSSAATVMVEN